MIKCIVTLPAYEIELSEADDKDLIYLYNGQPWNINLSKELSNSNFIKWKELKLSKNLYPSITLEGIQYLHEKGLI